MYKHRIVWTCVITFLFTLGFIQVMHLTRTAPGTISYMVEGVLIGIVMGLLYAEARLFNDNK